MKKIRVGNLFFWFLILLNSYIFIPYIYRSCVKISKLELEKNAIREKITVSRDKLETYNNSINGMKNKFEREKIARNKLQMVKNGELIYRFTDKDRGKNNGHT